jgi:lysine 2-monooxygenase
MDAQYDVVVVGGGVAGTYAAWRMLTGQVSPTSPLPPEPADRRVALFELSDRIGGRLESLTPPGTQNLRAEFGGMGFTSNNTILTALVDDVFKLPAEPFPLGGPDNLIYVRGVHFTKGQSTDPSIVPYRLAPNEQGNNPMQLIVNAIEAVLPGASNYTPTQWEQVKENFIYHGLHLNEIGFWNFLSMNMSNEAFAYAHDGMGHFFQVANWNCAEALPWFLGDGTATYRTLTDGYEQLPLTLGEAFTQAGGQTFMSTPVATVQQQTTGPQGATTMVVSTEGGPTVTATAVVLAMPQRSLELLDEDTVVLNEPSVQQLAGSVTGHQVMKVFCCYDEPWWTPLNITNGSSATDLPIGNVWYFGPDSATNNNSLLLATYNDTLATTYWEGLTSGPRYQGQLEPADVDPHWLEQAPSELMVQEIQTQLAELHQLSNIPMPYSAAMKDWSQDPYGGAFYTWNVGVDAESIAVSMLQPDSSVPLYICGETYSHDQGWAEGALDTAEQVVSQLGVEPPEWLSKPMDLVPSGVTEGE